MSVLACCPHVTVLSSDGDEGIFAQPQEAGGVRRSSFKQRANRPTSSDCYSDAHSSAKGNYSRMTRFVLAPPWMPLNRTYTHFTRNEMIDSEGELPSSMLLRWANGGEGRGTGAEEEVRTLSDRRVCSA